MASLLMVAFGFALLVLESSFGVLFPMYSFAPNPLLPIAIFLGVSAEVQIVRGALICFVLGYLLDAFCGSPMGLQTFVLTASFMVGRGAGIRLFPQGPILQMLLIFLTATGYGVTVLALRAIFDAPSLTLVREAATDQLAPVLRSAVATALISPLIFVGARRIETVGTRKREQRTVSS